MREIGFTTISEDRVYTSAVATARVIRSRSLRPLLLIDDALLPDFQGIDTTEPNNVVIGLAPEKFTYDKVY